MACQHCLPHYNFCVIDTVTLATEVAAYFVLVTKQKKDSIAMRCSGSLGGWGIKLNWGWCWQLPVVAEAIFKRKLSLAVKSCHRNGSVVFALQEKMCQLKQRQSIGAQKLWGWPSGSWH